MDAELCVPQDELSRCVSGDDAAPAARRGDCGHAVDRQLVQYRLVDGRRSDLIGIDVIEEGYGPAERERDEVAPRGDVLRGLGAVLGEELLETRKLADFVLHIL